MTSNFFKEEGSKAEEEPVRMNNFFFNLLPPDHDASFRNERHGAKDKKRKKLFEAIDLLLENEFSHLDIKRILEDICKEEQSINDLIKISRQYSSLEEMRKDEAHKEIFEKLDRDRKRFVEGNEELRPLFNKLLEMGFDLQLLKG